MRVLSFGLSATLAVATSWLACDSNRANPAPPAWGPSSASTVTPASESPKARHRRRRNANPYAPTEAPVIAAPTGTAAPSGAPLAGGVQLRVTFIDVGQGDGALLESADGHAAMIDTGPPEGISHLREVLAAHHVAQLDWLLLTHPHLDHIGGAMAVFDATHVARVIDSAYPHPTATYDRLLARIQAQSIPYTRGVTGLTLALGANVHAEVLQPHDPFVQGSRSDVNSNSIVTRVGVGAVHVLFTGDAERETEQRLLAENRAQLGADVLKVAHHGSRFASSAEFLDAVHPRYAVISCAQGNDYGHPHAETLSALAQRGIQWFRTDVNGDVTLSTDGATVSFAVARPASPEALMAPGPPSARHAREPQ